MRPALFACGLSLLGFAFDGAGATLPSQADLGAIVADVKAAEAAFAKTMADRRLDQFTGFVAEDAVFVGTTTRIGRADVVAKWSEFFKTPLAPFSWSPDAVAAAADGRTALSTGLARDAGGKVIGRFTSLWRKDPDGRWRIVADQGVDAGACAEDKK